MAAAAVKSELAEKRSGNPAHKCRRQKNRDHRERGRYHGQSDLIGRLKRGL